MATDVSNDNTPAPGSHINPRTGAVWRLTDTEVAPGVGSFQSSLQADPAKALEYLKKNGFLTAGGNVPRKYGGR